MWGPLFDISFLTISKSKISRRAPHIRFYYWAMNSQSTAWRQFCKKIVSTVKSAYRRLVSNESNRSTDMSKIYYYIVMMVSCQHCMWRYSWDVVNVSKWLCWVGFVSCLFVVWDLVYYSLWRHHLSQQSRQSFSRNQWGLVKGDELYE